MVDTKYLKRSNVWFPHFVGQRHAVKRTIVDIKERKKLNEASDCEYIPPELMSPEMYTAMVANRGRNSLNAGRILRMKIYNRLPESFYIEVKHMKNSDDVTAALLSVAMNGNVISLQDIYHIISEKKNSLKSIVNLDTLKDIDNTIKNLTGHIDNIPRIEIWGYLLMAISNYMFYPSGKLDNHSYVSICNNILRLIITNDIINLYAQTIESAITLYAEYENENGNNQNITNMLIEIASGAPDSANRFIDFHNSKERALGSSNKRKYWYEDCNRIIHYDYEEEQYEAENANLGADPEINRKIRSTIIDRQSFQGITNTLLNRFERGDIIMDNIYGGLVSDVNDALGNSYNYSWWEKSGGSSGGDNPLSCLFNVAMNASGICSSLDSLKSILNRATSINNIINLGNITDKLNGFELPSNWLSLLGNPADLLKELVLNQLQKIVRQVRQTLSESITGLDIDNSLLQCVGWERLINTSNETTRHIMNSWDNSLAKISNSDMATFKAGDDLLSAINKSDAMNDVSSFLGDVKDTLGGIIGNVEMGICDSDTVNSMINNAIGNNTKDNSDIFDKDFSKEKVSNTDNVFGDKFDPVTPMITGTRQYKLDQDSTIDNNEQDYKVSSSGDLQIKAMEESRPDASERRSKLLTESVVLLWRA